MDMLWFFCVPGIDNRLLNYNFLIWFLLNLGVWIFFGAFMGLLGSVLDSLLGATLQGSWFNARNKTIINDKVEADRLKIIGGETEIKWICGYNVLTNDQVNLISSVLVSVVGGLMGKKLFASKMPYF